MKNAMIAGLMMLALTSIAHAEKINCTIQSSAFGDVCDGVPAGQKCVPDENSKSVTYTMKDEFRDGSFFSKVLYNDADVQLTAQKSNLRRDPELRMVLTVKRQNLLVGTKGGQFSIEAHGSHPDYNFDCSVLDDQESNN